jgi:hypothetical protein
MDEGGKKNLIFATNGRKEGRGDLWEAFGGDLCEAKVAAAEGLGGSPRDLRCGGGDPIGNGDGAEWGAKTLDL